MNLCYLVMTVTLLASCVATATASLSQSDVTRSVANTDDKRFLRSLKAKLNVDTNSQDEERAIGNVDKVDDIAEKLDDIITKMNDNVPSLVTMFEKWRNKFTAEEILRTPTVKALREASNDDFMKMFNLYGEFNALGKETFLNKYKLIKDAAQR